MADERRLKQVVFHLLSNAIKYSMGGGKVVLGAERGPDGLSLWIEDQGIGIDEADRASVFERFQRGSRPDASHGAGLGLAMVKSFVGLHGGEVRFDPDREIGLRVDVFLPTAPPQPDST